MNPIVPAIGIDFGTSNSKMAWYNPRINQAEIIRNAEGEEQTPSVVYFGDAQILVGSTAEEMLEYEQERDRIIISIKRELITTPLLALPGKTVRAVEVAAEILRKLKRDAEDFHFHQEVTRAVITYPASFGLIERDRIRAAAQLAGFNEVELLEEPVAAAIAYAQMGLQVGKYVLVYDLGGGTFDLAVLVREDDGIYRLALEPQGIKRCGGDDFDEALYNYCDTIARKQMGRPISLTDRRNLHFLNQCRQRKENLSTVERRLFKSLLEPGALTFQLSIERVIFENLIRATVEETVRKTKVILEQASAEGYQVDTLVLIGGSSRVPLVKNILKEQLALSVSYWQNQDVAVALGAAYAAHRLWGSVVSVAPIVRKLKEQWLAEGNALLKLKQYEEGLAAYEQTIGLDPNFASAWYNKGDALILLDRYEEASVAYAYALQLDLDLLAVHFSREGLLHLLDLNHYEDILAILGYALICTIDPSIRLIPDSPIPLFIYAGVLYGFGRKEEALAVIEQAISIAPMSPLAYLVRAVHAEQQGEEALVALQQAVELVPNSALDYFAQAYALIGLERAEEAFALIDKAIQLAPTSSTPYLIKAFIFLVSEEKEEAFATIEQAIKLIPNPLLAHFFRVVALAYLEQEEQALALLQQTAELIPNSRLAQLTKAISLAFLEAKEVPENEDVAVFAVLDKAAILYSDTSLSLFLKALVLASREEFEAALTMLIQATGDDPDFILLQAFKGGLLYELQRYGEVIDTIEQVLQLVPNCALVHFIKATVLTELNREDEALTAYDQAMALDPNVVNWFSKKEEAQSKSLEPGAAPGQGLRALAAEALAQGRELYRHTTGELAGPSPGSS